MEENTTSPIPPIPQVVTNPVQPEVPVTSPPGSMPKKKMSIGAIIGAILFLLLAGAAGFVYKDQIISMVVKPTPSPAKVMTKAETPSPSPTPDPTSDWKTFENKEYGFSFKYPNDLFTDCSNIDHIEYTELIRLYDKNGTGFKEQPKQYCNTAPISLRIVPQLFVPQKSDGYWKVTSDQVKLSGQTFKTYVSVQTHFHDGEGISNPCEKFVSIPITSGNKNYYISYCLMKSNSITEATINQILSTFKFTNQASTPTPTCMKRPACLDATPRCMIAEPVNGWCP